MKTTITIVILVLTIYIGWKLGEWYYDKYRSGGMMNTTDLKQQLLNEKVKLSFESNPNAAKRISDIDSILNTLQP